MSTSGGSPTELLPNSWVEEAIKEELDYSGEKVWTMVPAEEAFKDPEANIVGSRWVICNKNDPSNPDVRARLVAREINTHAGHAFFAATPPLESKRMLFSQWASERTRNGAMLKLSFFDIRKA